MNRFQYTCSQCNRSQMFSMIGRAARENRVRMTASWNKSRKDDTYDDA